MAQGYASMERRGRPLSVTILETYRRLIKHGLPSARERIARRGLTFSEIARITNTSRTTVKKYLPSLVEQEKRKAAGCVPPDDKMPDAVP